MRWSIAVVLMLTLAGCFGGDDDGDTSPTTTTTTTTAGTTTTTTGTATTTATTTETAEPRAPVTWDVDVADNEFSPASLTIQVGDTVRWTQSGTNPHTVTEDDDSFDSHPDCDEFADSVLGNCMAEGDTHEETFTEAGEVGYYCKIHGGPGSGMAGTITVLERHDETP